MGTARIFSIGKAEEEVIERPWATGFNPTILESTLVGIGHNKSSTASLMLARVQPSFPTQCNGTNKKSLDSCRRNGKKKGARQAKDSSILKIPSIPYPLKRNGDEFNLYNTNRSTSTCLHGKDEVQDQSVHMLSEMPLLPPFVQDPHNLRHPQQQSQWTPCIAGRIKRERINR
ncbi:unnamed protein product [Dovyalis caffra]|uniref:Uncharacterized protein n=1 Tax=Dovyalis caffra TaxID=77055 RepID=A0AAV1SFH3_9ROSI|nr:unnamed protein product [Dovyalis caffra]